MHLAYKVSEWLSPLEVMVGKEVSSWQYLRIEGAYRGVSGIEPSKLLQIECPEKWCPNALPHLKCPSITCSLKHISPFASKSTMNNCFRRQRVKSHNGKNKFPVQICLFSWSKLTPAHLSHSTFLGTVFSPSLKIKNRGGRNTPWRWDLITNH